MVRIKMTNIKMDSKTHPDKYSANLLTKETHAKLPLPRTAVPLADIQLCPAADDAGAAFGRGAAASARGLCLDFEAGALRDYRGDVVSVQCFEFDWAGNWWEFQEHQ
jgi:hypothetical protein